MSVVTPFGRRTPIPMILHCPNCHVLHEDAPDQSRAWTNPPHISHKCNSCGCIWRPADVPTTGVRYIKTKGLNDTVDNRNLRLLAANVLADNAGDTT